MGNMFSQKCDLCGKVQSEEDHTKIQGTTFVMNGVSRFACGECRDILNAAFATNGEGLRNPMLELAKVVKERDQLKRMIEQGAVQREQGTVALAGVELDHMAAQNWNRLAPEHRIGLAPASVPIPGRLSHTPPAQHKLGVADPKKDDGAAEKEDKKKKKK